MKFFSKVSTNLIITFTILVSSIYTESKAQNKERVKEQLNQINSFCEIKSDADKISGGTKFFSNLQSLMENKKVLLLVDKESSQNKKYGTYKKCFEMIEGAFF